MGSNSDFGFASFTARGLGATRELIRDPHFQDRFNLIDPKPGRRFSYGHLAGAQTNREVFSDRSDHDREWISVALPPWTVCRRRVSLPTEPRRIVWHAISNRLIVQGD
jgi:hypothetical protein